MRNRVARVVGIAVVVLGLGASSAAALPPTNYTWTGAGSDPNWSNSDNWTAGAPASSTTVGTLTFPQLSGCTGTCYNSTDDLTNLTVGGLNIDAGPGYFIDSDNGQGITLGSGGITANDPNSDYNGASVEFPIALGADQTWSLDQGELFIDGNVTGNHTLGLALSNGGFLELPGTNNVGAVTINGSATSSNGESAFDNGNVQVVQGELNGTDGNPIALNHAALQGSGSFGPITSTGGFLGVAGFSTHAGTQTMAVHGNVTLDSATATDFTFFDPTSSGRYSQLTATGNVTVGGDLVLRLGYPDCPQLTVGQVFTLVNATGTRTGTFANVPENTTLQTSASKACQNSATLRINYTAHTVTGTVTASTQPVPRNFGDPPTIGGALTVGSTLTESHGSGWSPAPDGYTYQWYRCNAGDYVFGASCNPIAGATGQTYQLQLADQGHELFVDEGAHDSTGYGYDQSDLTGVVQPGSGGGGSGGGGGGVVVTPPTDGQILSNLNADILPTGLLARIKAILKNGGYVQAFQALTGGSAEIDWYFVPKGAHVTTAKKHKKKKVVLIAKGTHTFTAAGNGTITIKLTSAGRKKLKKAKKLKLTAKGKFTRTGGKPVVTLKPFTIKK